MGLLTALALLRVHVLVVEVPGRPMLRLRAEAAVRARGWVLTAAPEDTDLLLVCGTPSGEVVSAIEGLWRRVPRPRARRTVRWTADVPTVLDSAARVLGDDALQRSAAAAPPPHDPPAGPPAGRVRFGPVLPDWPAGLVVDCAVGSDGGVVSADLRLAAAEPDDPDPAGAHDLALTVADAARLLRLAARGLHAARLDGVVDAALGGAEEEVLRRRIRSVAAGAARPPLLGRSWAGRDEVLALLRAAEEGRPWAGPVRPDPALLVGARLDAVPLLVAGAQADRVRA